MAKQVSPFFIVSSGRSGTTLLSAMLNASEQVMIPPESDFIARAFPFYDGKEPLTEEDLTVLADFFLLTSQKEWGFDRDGLVDILRETRPGNFRETNAVIYASYLEKQGGAGCQWGIKRPVLIAGVERIRAVFKNAKIIHLVRDGRDVALSYRKVHLTGSGFGPKSTLPSCLYWVDGLRRLERLGIDVMLEIRYEDLLSDPQHVLKRVCDFLNIEYDKSSLEKYYLSEKNMNFLRAKHRNSIHSKVKEGIDSCNFGKYKKEMGACQRFIFELFAAPYLRRYGYELEFASLGSPLLGVVRVPAFSAARLYNNVRYALRDRKRHARAKRRSLSTERQNRTPNPSPKSGGQW